jgi:hypothetical protein
MNLPTLPTLLSLITAALVLSLASVRADGFDPRNLLILDEDNGVTYEDWVSTDPLETHTVKKVEAGRVSYVTITRTSTGTYSTDGFASPNVIYPASSSPLTHGMSSAFRAGAMAAGTASAPRTAIPTSRSRPIRRIAAKRGHQPASRPQASGIARFSPSRTASRA